MSIKLLDQEVVSQIAAGEVVERPASVVKELVENSLDAGSSQISVEVRGGGISLIRVTDDGSGIPSQEAELAFKRYATSKVSSVEDLASIASLGFRGEALPSIAAVAHVDMLTCVTGESAGDHLSLRDGIVDRRIQSRSQGTTVTVRSLFRRVPARLKFLKAPATENSHIAQVVTQYALAFPEVKFFLSIDGRAVLRSPGSGRLLDVVIEAYGLEVAQNMVEIGGSEGSWDSGKAGAPPLITGMISVPNLNRSNRDYISFFVNRRWINNRLLTWVVEEAYRGLLMQGRHPIAIINISLPPDEVDVNIHPAKAEVNFQNKRAVLGAVQKAVREALIGMAPVPKIEEVATAYGAPSRMSQEVQALLEADTIPTTPPPVAEQVPMVSLPALRILGQLSSSYIIAEGPDGLYLIDQHAAHERILYERLKDQRAQKEIEVQGLLEPVPFEVNPGQDEVLKSSYQELAEFGFSIEPFGDHTYLVRAVPALLHNKDWAGMVRELLDDPPEKDRGLWKDKIAISLACHSAIRAGQVLADDEMRELVRQLEQASMPRTCPHGRPTVIHLSLQQLEREFHRR
jgi:DNA mismatch repair protein MutL